jgi:hypothetical protein
LNRFTPLPGNFLQKRNRKESGRTVIQRIFVAQAIATMQIANVGKFYADALRTVGALVHIRNLLPTGNDDYLEAALMPSARTSPPV